ncbi:TPA: integrase [Legionella pneumophila]|nr:integrase [Legionella pneumophila]HAT8971052.1 integrase [Legionella pneumophila subsp. pneumophila]HAT7904222.1 integrase [Legionella pneumophila]HAT8339333.1 integrase [Legionella pneumophila]HAT8345660.1 integrase [Legionella pneumophila]
MRTQSLRQFANRQIKQDRQGKYLYRKHRAYVIHKMIDDLFVIRQMPPSWQALQSEQVHKLVRFWKKQNINPVTIMRYMTIIRRFLQMNNCPVANIDNQSLELSRPKARKKRKKTISPDIWKSLHDPIARVIMGLQTEFGLTFKEAILIKPHIQVREDSLWITRDIAFNSTDRTIPVRTENQKAVLNLFNWLTQQNGNLLQLKSYEEIRIIWRSALAKHRLSSTKSWRYLYAKQMYSCLLPEYENYKTCLLIRDEMGIKSRNTLWLYLKE